MRETIAGELGGHVARMYRVALRIVGSKDTAQEIAQDACVKALRGADKFDGRAAVATWLHRITVNCAHDRMRKDRRAHEGTLAGDHDVAGAQTAVEAGPAERAERSDTYRLALSLLAKLPDDCRSAFVLTQLDGYTYDEAAAIENLARGTIASRVYRARQILMEQIAERLGGEIP